MQNTIGQHDSLQDEEVCHRPSGRARSGHEDPWEVSGRSESRGAGKKGWQAATQKGNSPVSWLPQGTGFMFIMFGSVWKCLYIFSSDSLWRLMRGL